MVFERHRSAVVLASALTAASFMAATAYTVHRLRALDNLSATIANNAVPSVEYLGRSGVRLLRLRQLIFETLVPVRGHADTMTSAHDELQALNHDIDQYLRITPLPGEGELWDQMRRDLDHASQLAASVLLAEGKGDTDAAQRLFAEAIPAFDRASQTMLETMEFDVKESERLAHEVRAVRRANTRNIILLDMLAAVVAAVSTVVALRAARDHDRLLETHSAMLSERVTELDRFAGRVAHDILSPLDAVSMGLALISATGDSGSRGYAERSSRALQRVRLLVEGLLQYARAGGRAESPARTSVASVLENVLSDCREGGRASDIEVTVTSAEALEVACSAAVLTSIVENLVANALKYMGQRTVRRIDVRASRAGDHVRIEVADTGPGIPTEFQNTIFEPFVRGPQESASGMGLGLATVKRLVKAHGGTITLRSAPEKGTTFCVELPGAGLPESPLP
jgi:signal transduction histidine kinase